MAFNLSNIVPVAWLPVRDHVLTKPHIIRLARARDFEKIMEALVYADFASSISLSIEIGFSHEFGCQQGLMVTDRSQDYVARANALLHGKSAGTFRCNLCGQSYNYGAEWIQNCFQQGRILLRAPRPDEIQYVGVQKALQQISRIRAGGKPW